MRLYIYILLLLFYSCDELGEESGPLDYNGLIAEGWNNFMQGDYVKSQEFFLDVLDIDPSLISYYSEAYLGLGFSTLFEANNITGIDSVSFLNRFNLRTQSKDWFFEVIDEVDSYVGEEPIRENLILDLNAGLAFTYSSLALYNEFDPYMLIGTTEEFVNNALNYSELVISNDPNYSFTYSTEDINSNTLHLLRAQLFLEIEDYNQALQEILMIDSQSINVTFKVNSNDDQNSYKIFLNGGFQSQDKHLFEMSSISNGVFEVDRTLTPLLPCTDLVNETFTITNNEIVECINSFTSNIYEYSFSMQVPNSINTNLVDQSSCETSSLEWVEGVGCVDSWMYIEEQLEEQDCINNGYRNLLIENSDAIIVNACFGTCVDC